MKKVSTNTGDITELDGKIKANRLDIGINDGRIEDNEEDISENDGAISSNIQNMNKNADELENFQNSTMDEIAEQAEAIANNTADTENNENNIQNNAKDIDQLEVHWGQKRSDRARFLKANFDGFWPFSQKVLKIQKLYIPHLKALIYSYYEPEGQGVWCLHMTARLL